MTILQQILADTEKRVQLSKQLIPLSQLQADISAMTEQPKDLLAAMQQAIAKHGVAVIAEVKFASPSKGTIAANNCVDNAVTIAQQYQDNGAAAISVLTEPYYFAGDLNYLRQVAAAVAIPVIRKDFIIDSYQIYEAKAYGASAVLLIIAALTEAKFLELYNLAKKLNLSVLIEVHSESELETAKLVECDIIGVNNRNLHSFAIDVNVTLQLKQQCDKQIIVSESGISNSNLKTLATNQIQSYLVGTSFMTTDSPGVALQSFIQTYNASLD